MREQADVTGQTEPSILRATLRLHDIAEDEPYLSRYQVGLAQEYDDHRQELLRRGRALPGARETLSMLFSDQHVVQSVLSGNLRAVSMIKLETFDLDRYLDVEVGAYGDDESDRPRLVAIAQKRAETKYGAPFGRENTIIIGDSTHDIATGKTGGASTLGVATGSDGIDALRAAGADAVVPDLTDAAEIHKLLRSLIN
ncbi:haloacid dehalogenase [Mangrovihabitans endophyticus]|uniref:Haloacid dehalogenase n=2 Tax=Mangrovihabitans endophyticus TaxID=1751298 RepID=A0A8J3FS45_9ACTN|nr:haloacid dehalogenase [Mangrovihabitans endophyticus]